MFHLDTLLHSHRLTPRLTGVSTGHTTQSTDTYRSALASGCAFILSLSPPAGQADIRVISEYKIGTGVPSAGRSARPEDGGRGRPRLVYRPRSEPGLSGLSLGREAVVWSVWPWSGQGFGTPQWGLQRNTSLSDRCQHETSTARQRGSVPTVGLTLSQLCNKSVKTRYAPSQVSNRHDTFGVLLGFVFMETSRTRFRRRCTIALIQLQLRGRP